jgi:hypothetical protein
MARPAETREPDTRYVFQCRFKGKAIDWMEKTAAAMGTDTSTLARELFALGSQHWQKAHPEHIDPAAQRA